MAARGGGKRMKRYNAETKLIKKPKVAKQLTDAGVTITADQDGTGSESKFCWHVTMTGPAKYLIQGSERDSPYGGKQFHLELQFPEKYPFKPPVDGEDAGKLCDDFIKKFWTGPTKKAHELVFHIMSLLANPDLDTALDETISREIRENTGAFEKKVRSKYK